MLLLTTKSFELYQTSSLSLAMNSTLTPDPSVGLFSSDKIGGFGYGIAVSVGILILITTITLASYYCTRVNTMPLMPVGVPGLDWHRHDIGSPATADIEAGLDEATLRGYPKGLYSEFNKKGTAAGSCCSICLADYKDSDELRQLPECSHVFHLRCVDPWLRSHPTCPLCRTSPMPTPMPTPLAEVVPLARQQG